MPFFTFFKHRLSALLQQNPLESGNSRSVRSVPCWLSLISTIDRSGKMWREALWFLSTLGWWIRPLSKVPVGSMYGISTYIYLIFYGKCEKYTIHRSYGVVSNTRDTPLNLLPTCYKPMGGNCLGCAISWCVVAFLRIEKNPWPHV